MESYKRIVLFERSRSDVRCTGGDIPDDGNRTAVLLTVRFDLVIVVSDTQDLCKADMPHGGPIADPVDEHVAA